MLSAVPDHKLFAHSHCALAIVNSPFEDIGTMLSPALAKSSITLVNIVLFEEY